MHHDVTVHNSFQLFLIIQLVLFCNRSKNFYHIFIEILFCYFSFFSVPVVYVVSVFQIFFHVFELRYFVICVCLTMYSLKNCIISGAVANKFSNFTCCCSYNICCNFKGLNLFDFFFYTFQKFELVI